MRALKITAIGIIILLFYCCKKDTDLNTIESIDSNKNNNVNTKTLDSLKKLGFDIYQEYDFYNFSGTKIVNEKIDYPITAVKKDKKGYKVLTLIASDSLVSRELEKKGESTYIEKIENFKSYDEIDRSVFVIVYKKDLIVVFDFLEDVSSDNENKFSLMTVYFIYKDKIEEYSQYDNAQRLIKDIDETNYSITKSQLNNVFTSPYKIDKQIYYLGKNYGEINNSFLKSYLLLKD